MEIAFLSLVILSIFEIALFAPSCPYFQYVDMTIGSSGMGFGYGSVNPAVQSPFGSLRAGFCFRCSSFYFLIFLVGLDTTSSKVDLSYRHFSGFNYYDTFIRSFSHTRLVGAGVPDLGNFGIMPYCKESLPGSDWTPIQEDIWWQPFDHTTFEVAPGYLSVVLPDCDDLKIEVVSGGFQTAKYLFSTTSKNPLAGYIVLDVCHSVLEAMQTGPSICKMSSIVIDIDKKRVEGSVLFGGSLSGRNSENGGGINIFFSISFSQENDQGISSDIFPYTWNLFDADGLREDANENEILENTNGYLGAFLGFDQDSFDGLVLNIGISFISQDQSFSNLQQQILTSSKGSYSSEEGEMRFDELVERTQTIWCEELSKFQVTEEDSSLSDYEIEMKTKLYSSFYRTLLTPTQYGEYDSSIQDWVYMGMDNKVHVLNEDGDIPQSSSLTNFYLSDMSIWDTHRTFNPLMLFYRQDVAQSILNSLYLMTKDGGGSIPQWPLANVFTGCMIGNHAYSILIESLQKDGVDFPSHFQTTFYESMRDQTFFGNASHGSRGSQELLNSWWEDGVVLTSESDKATSLALSFAFDDYSVSQLAKELGYLDESEMYWKSSKKYKNMWNVKNEFMCPVIEDDEIVSSRNSHFKKTDPLHNKPKTHCPINPNKLSGFEIDGGYVEGNVWQWSWFVPHDLEGLSQLFESKKDFTSKLSTFFDGSVEYHEKYGNLLPNVYYWAGNEPDLLSPYLFAFSSNISLTQYWTRQLIDTYYPNSPIGVPGNDDYGTMSSWLIFSCLGLYPISSTTQYVLTSPCLPEMKLEIVNGDDQEENSILTIKSYNFYSSDDKNQENEEEVQQQQKPNVYLSKVIINSEIELNLWSSEEDPEKEIDQPIVDHNDLFYETFILTEDQEEGKKNQDNLKKKKRRRKEILIEYWFV